MTGRAGPFFSIYEIELLRATDWYWDAIGDISVHDQNISSLDLVHFVDAYHL